MAFRKAAETVRLVPASRRGLATGETLVLLVAGVVMTSASFFLVPQAIQGMTTPKLPPDEPPRSPDLLPSYTAVRLLLASCHDIVAVHEGTETGLTEVVVWHKDVDVDGLIDPSELVLLTHSSFLGQVSAAALEWQPSPDDRDYSRLTSPIAVASAQSSAFPTDWRNRPDVSVSPISVGIDGFRLVRLDEKFGEKVWRVELLWSPDVSDAYEDRMSSFVVTPGSER